MDANAALLTATESGDVVSMRRLLEIGYLRENNQVSVLMSASKSGHADCVKLLLDYGIDVNILNENGQSTLMIACKHGHSDVVQILLNHGAQTNLQDKDGVSPLMIASEAGNFEIAKQLLKHGTSVGLQNSNGWTAVMLASYNNHVKVVETLLKCGGKVEKEFLVQLSPSRHAKVLELLQNQLGMNISANIYVCMTVYHYTNLALILCIHPSHGKSKDVIRSQAQLCCLPRSQAQLIICCLPRLAC